MIIYMGIGIRSITILAICNNLGSFSYVNSKLGCSSNRATEYKSYTRKQIYLISFSNIKFSL